MLDLHWNSINAACLFGSLLLLLLVMLFGLDDKEGRTVSKQVFLFYDLITTIVWVAEVVDLRLQHIHADKSWHLYLELGLAVYFSGDALMSLLSWDFKTNNMFIVFADLIFNSLGYYYMLTEARKGLATTEPYDSLE